MNFPDHFSPIAANYAAFRPTYPDALFAWLAATAPDHTAVWDCACGNGQASQGLAKYFDHVIATDASAEQIRNAKPDPKIDYRVAPAENSGLADKSVDLITIAQAIHWFDFDAFYKEVRRVLKRGGLLAAWGYGWIHVEDDDLNRCTLAFQKETLGPYWPKQTKYIQNEYKTLPFPFNETMPPPFTMNASWTLAQLLGHFRSWSATKEYVLKRDADPVEAVEKELVPLWGDPNLARPVSWAFHMRAGRI